MGRGKKERLQNSKERQKVKEWGKRNGVGRQTEREIGRWKRKIKGRRISKEIGGERERGKTATKEENSTERVRKAVSTVCRREFFYSKFLEAGSHNQLPAPLGRNLADAWTKITEQNNRKKVLILLHDVYSHSQCDSQIHITTVVRPQFAGSGCAAKAFYSCPAIISHRPESQKTPKEPQ